LEATKFSILSGVVKTYQRDGKKRFRTIASSTVKDLHGDTIHRPAQERMQRDAHGMLLFLNHEYRVPQDVMGSVDDAQLSETGLLDAGGSPIVDLVLDGIVNETNPLAVQTWEAMDAGFKFGTSIGALIPPDGAKQNPQTGAWDIYDIQLLEASIVGVPANPRSWVQYATKSLRNASVLAAAGIERTAPGRAPNSEDDHMSTMTFVEPDIQDENTTVVTVTVNNTDDEPAQTESEEAVSPETGDGEVSLGDDVTLAQHEPEVTASVEDHAGFEQVFATLQAAVNRVGVLEAEVRSLTTERDSWKSNWEAAADIIARIERLPIGRKTAFVKASDDFRAKFSHIYGEEFMQFMEKR
jgi:phage head maturation protease